MNNNLVFLREEKDYLSKDMAKFLNIPPSVYSEWENNKLSISTKRLYELGEFFNVNIDYLVGLSSKRINLKTNKVLDQKETSLRLKEVRENMNLSMRELAQKLNTSSSAISNYENNKNLILSSFLIELSKISNYSIDYILGRNNIKFIQK